MMREKLNVFHIAILIYMIELDTTVFSQSRVLAENIGTNGWLALIPLSGLASVNLLLYRWVYRAGGGRSAYSLMEAVFPKALLAPAYVVLAVFWIFLGSLIGKNFILISQMLAFQSTNSMLIFLLYCMMLYALLVKDLYSIVKATTIFFILSFALNALVPYFYRDWSAMRLTTSVFQGSNTGQTFFGWVEAYMVFVGYELILFLFPYTDKKSKLFKGVFIGHWLITFVYIVAVLVSFGFFSFEELKELQFPLISTLEYLELPFLNRPENLAFTFFIFSNLVSSVMFCFASLTALRQLFPKSKPKLLEGAISAMAFAFGLSSRTLTESDELIQLAYYAEMALAFGMPLALVPTAYIAKRKERRAGA